MKLCKVKENATQTKLNKYWLPSIEACVKIKQNCVKTFKIRKKNYVLSQCAIWQI